VVQKVIMEFLYSTHLKENTQTMTSKEILGASMLDILFDNRNKTYGAYELRKNYNSRLLLAMGSALGFVFLLLLLFSNSESVSSGNNKDKKELIITEYIVPPKIVEQQPIVEKPAAPKPPKTTEASLTDIVKMVDDPDPEKEMAAIADAEKSAVGTHNTDGPENISFQSAAPVDPVISGNGEGKESSEQSDFIAIEEQPEFPGGAAAWKNFLSRYLQVPASLNGGELKIVKINFTVDVDGTVTGFNVIQSAGREFDNEVIRVLRKMPRWKPARQNGRAVAVPFTQPVTFVGVEQ
jgi:periplasmic protein TonB